MNKLKELNKLTDQYLKMHWDNGGTSEFDKSINDISREKIKALKELKGKCYLYQINKFHPSDPACVEYTGQKIYNFEYSLALPERNEEIIKIIDKRNTPSDEPYSGKRNMDEVNRIYDIAESIGEITLIWS